MAISCRGCRYLSAFGTLCLMGREKQRCREKRMREEPVTFADLLLQNRIDTLAASEDMGAAKAGAVGSSTG